MNAPFTFPIDSRGFIEEHCRMKTHTGVAKIRTHGVEVRGRHNPVEEFFKQLGRKQRDVAELEFPAHCMVPAASECLIQLLCPEDFRLSRNWGTDLTMAGDSTDGPFQLRCPRYYVSAASDRGENPGWAFAVPRNEPVTITYGAPPVTWSSVVAVINSFDFETGNTETAHGGEMLRIAAAGRSVDISWRPERLALHRLVAAKLLPTASFVTLCFSAWEGATENDLVEFADAVAGLCGIVVQQHTTNTVIEFQREDGTIGKRIIRNLLTSE